MNATKKYLIALIVTTIVFAIPFLVGNYLSSKKISLLKEENNKISIDILSFETKFELSGNISCTDFINSTLSQEMTRLGDKIAYSEENFGSDDKDVRDLKKYYSTLEIRDFLISEKIKNCDEKPIPILYFYTNYCPDCEKQGYILTYLREKYPMIRVYSFDKTIALSELDALSKKYNVTENFPTLVINGKKYEGYQNLKKLKSLLPELDMSTSTKKSNK